MKALRQPDGGAARLREEARAFLRQAYVEQGWTGLDGRLKEVERNLARFGAYTLTPDELRYGCHLAWRNSARCVGRSYWQYLDVRDLRHVTKVDEVFGALVEHLRTAWNGGSIRPTISVFGAGVRIVNDQLIRYAGYRQPDGSVTGDPKNVALTEFLQRHGWRGGPGTPFDVLPLAIRVNGQVHLRELPGDAVREVMFTHPDFDWFAGLNLKWHALPVISDMRLEIGGLSFECAPFNGWYVQTEIAARNLADHDRYDVLPVVARGMQLDTSRARSLWRDRALVELNVAVLHSFDEAGVKISDHHAVTQHFVNFEARERQAGRSVAGRWSWLVPPLSPATTPVYHRRYEDREERPNLYAQPRAWEETPALRTCPFHR